MLLQLLCAYSQQSNTQKYLDKKEMEIALKSLNNKFKVGLILGTNYDWWGVVTNSNKTNKIFY